MKKVLLLLTLIMSLTVNVNAQKNKDRGEKKAFEEATARSLEPFHAAYVIPIVYDVDVSSRQQFGPYAFEIKGDLKEWELQNNKKRAVYKPLLEVGADEMVGTLYDSYINESDPKTLYVTVSGYPCKWKNFRNLDANSKEIELIKVIYPSSGVNISFDGSQATKKSEEKDNKSTK